LFFYSSCQTAELQELPAFEAGTSVRKAVVEAKTHSMEPAGSRMVTYKSTADRAAVRAQAAEALRTGQIPHGEFSAM
jgi:hypothetical protein